MTNIYLYYMLVIFYLIQQSTETKYKRNNLIILLEHIHD